ncbi:beta-fructofuranosidase, insoluble isoenzyme CWINV1-like isoform X2 [Salvia miltiorrhiza]|uniref:beta-fructofuranosidase, insoluble isoenzyme CWINV1-like isoform X2 n=1 Tax=Salvia miltiorrhiza TaxID=226208 RepID=UPI0025AC3575|nr:beta-fructofuranosidase, insoluble isoenzyme CWINV1-like isoform X2 [Salvia miltiorrhiza]
MAYYLNYWLIICFISLLEIQSCLSSIQRDDQPYRTAYHFQPPKNWMNGPMIYKGIYHLFYQYNPKGAVWGNIVWAHSTSRDLINWTPHPTAISPTIPSDIKGCWSGSATILSKGKPVILYTGINSQNQQEQNVAIPKNLSDPNLIEWIKPSYNPVMAPTQQNMINASSFRDPTTAWLGRDGRWRLIVGNKVGRRGRALMFRSRDFVLWTQAKHPLYSRRGTGMWECPDFYPVLTRGEDGVDTSTVGRGVKHVLKASMNDGFFDSYAIGSYNLGKDVFVRERGSLRLDSQMRYDHGKFYASKTFFDSSTKRRVLWGWINESTDAAIDISKGWSGLQAIPRKIWLHKSGKQLVQWPVKEIEKLRKGKVTSPTKELKGGSVLEISGVTASQADVEISFEISTFKNVEELEPSMTDPQEICSDGAAKGGGVGPFGLLVLASKDIQEYTAVYFRVFIAKTRYVVLMCSDQSRSSLHLDYDKPMYGAFVDVDPVKEKLSLRTLIDRSIVESFGGEGKACITARVYPSLAIDGEAHLYAFNNGTNSVKISELAAWSMKAAQIN